MNYGLISGIVLMVCVLFVTVLVPVSPVPLQAWDCSGTQLKPIAAGCSGSVQATSCSGAQVTARWTPVRNVINNVQENKPLRTVLLRPVRAIKADCSGVQAAPACASCFR